MKFPTLALLILLTLPTSFAFVTHLHRANNPPVPTVMLAASVDSTLTPELKRMTDAFASIGDDKLRYKQLLYMANQLPPLQHPENVMVPKNKVPGCLSTVYIDGSCTYDPKRNDYVIDFVGDSDGLLTKGLVALLVRGLSGCTADEINQVDPSFIRTAKISQSLTPGRNNGFLNMLQVMKRKARDLEENAKSGVVKSDNDSGENASFNDEHQSNVADKDHRPIYNAMMTTLQQLKPTSINLVDNSHQHAGHAGSLGFNGESHFDLTIVSEAFEGLNLVKRHQLIYMILGEIMPKIHALSIKANTPDEVKQE
jgi:sulfur transfer protein SufE/stress-induced morphogen